MSWLKIKASSSNSKEGPPPTSKVEQKRPAEKVVEPVQGETSVSASARAVVDTDDDSKSEKGKDEKISLTPSGGLLGQLKAVSPALHAAFTAMLKTARVKGGGKFGRSGKGGKSGSPPVMKINCVVAVTVQPGSGGQYFNTFGGLALSATTDFGTASGLFDICRCTKIQVRYQAMAPGATPRIGGSTTLTGNHVPLAAWYDPEAAGASSWATVVNQRDWTDHKLNKFANTGVAWEHTWNMTLKKLLVEDSGPVLGTTLGQWNDTITYGQNLVGGSVNVAIYPEAQNYQTGSGAVLGTAIVVWETEWSYRL